MVLILYLIKLIGNLTEHTETSGGETEEGRIPLVTRQKNGEIKRKTSYSKFSLVCRTPEESES